MLLIVSAVGRMKKGPERELADRYWHRLTRAGPAVGLDCAGVAEISESRAGSAARRRSDEAGHALSLVEDRAGTLIALDETGDTLTSQAFADRIGQMRDDGVRRAVFAIGGPDGHAPELLSRADLTVSLGRMTWPHQIARILLAEQLYRAATILAGHPYHRQ